MNTSTNKSSVSQTEFRENDLVFAKIKGHKHWPAQINKIDRSFKTVTKYEVTFFGTNQKATVNNNDICSYSENKLKFTLQSVALRNRDEFKKALEEVENVCKSAAGLLNRVGGPTVDKHTKSPLTSKAQIQSSTPHSFVSANSSKQSPSPPSTIEWLKSLKKTKTTCNYTQTDLKIDWTLESLISELEKTKAGADAVVDKCQEFSLENVKLNNDLGAANKRVQELLNRIADLEKGLKLEKSLHTKQIDVNLGQKKEFENKKSKLSSLSDEINNLKGLVSQKDLLINKLNTQLEVMNEQSKADQDIISEQNAKLIAYEKELHELNNFYQQGDIAVKSPTSGIPASSNSFSCLDTSRNSPTRVDRVNQHATNKTLQQNLKLNTRQQLSGEKTPKKKTGPKLTFISDSYGRYLQSNLDYQLSKKYVSFGYILPNAGMKKILRVAERDKELKTFTKSDYLVWIAGTNDVSTEFPGLQDLPTILLTNIENAASKFTHTNLILATVPHRYDLHQDSLENKIIWRMNEGIRHLTVKYSHLHLLDLWLFPRPLYTGKGIHFNKHGNRQFALEIKNLIDNSCKSQCSLSEGIVQLTEEPMTNLIDKHKDDKSVGFAHSISADLEDSGHMTAGVAVVFKRYIGKPQTSQLLSSHLALQKSNTGVSIYSLITKSKYFGKPHLYDYDLAFRDLTDDFKKRELKHLICSPVGCVRDHIQLPHFFNNLRKFHNATGAKITIVSSPQESKKSVLRNGLTHDEFNLQIHSLINPPSQDASTTCGDSQQPVNTSAAAPLSTETADINTAPPTSHTADPLQTSSHSEDVVSVVVPGVLTYCETLKQSTGVVHSLNSSLVNAGNNPDFLDK